MTRRLLASFLAAAICLTSTAALWAAGPDILRFKDVAIGMKGTGRTVFKGTAIEEFNVEIIGTMENILPKKNLIMARLEGGPLRDTGIMEGMSGSPVYINGKLIGAVAYSWGFAKEPICGITPIEEMMEVLERGTTLPDGTAKTSALPSRRAGDPAPVSLLAYPDRMVSFLHDAARRLAPVLGGGPALPAAITRLQPTLIFSGYKAEATRDWFDLFQSMALRPTMMGKPAGVPAAAGTAALSAAKEIPFSGGSAFGVNLVRGDLDVTAIGTVTWTDGERMVGFGHPFLEMGETAMPMHKAYVFGYFPSLNTSFKLAGPLEEFGAITQDRFAGVAGRKGASVKMVPVRVELKHSDGTSRSYRFDIVPDPLLTPGLLNVSLLSLLSAEEKGVGDITLRLREGSRIQMPGDLDVKLDNIFSGEQSVLYASGTVAYMTYLLLNNEDRPAQIEGVNLLFDYTDGRRISRVEKIWLDRYIAAPGETLNLHVSVLPFRGEPTTVDIPLKIPAEAPEGKALLQVGDSLTLSRMESVAGGAPYFVPKSLEHLVWLLNHIRANQKLYATLIRPDNGAFIAGERLPNLPPSIASVLLQPMSQQDNAARVRFRSLLEAEAATTSVVRGYQKTVIEIRK